MAGVYVADCPLTTVTTKKYIAGATFLGKGALECGVGLLERDGYISIPRDGRSTGSKERS